MPDKRLVCGHNTDNHVQYAFTQTIFIFMELVFTIFAGLGAFLIIIGYLGFVFAGFRHHFVTGIISALPVLNIVTIPALWPKAGKKVITSIIGIIIITASWFLGANTGIQKYLGILKGNKQTTLTTITATNNNTSNIPNSSSAQVIPVVTPLATNENEMLQLPKKALYKMKFEVIPVENIQTLKNRVVRIITTNNDQFEGRITNITISSIFIQNSELPIANIKKISLMVKKAN